MIWLRRFFTEGLMLRTRVLFVFFFLLVGPAGVMAQTQRTFTVDDALNVLNARPFGNGKFEDSQRAA